MKRLCFCLILTISLGAFAQKVKVKPSQSQLNSDYQLDVKSVKEEGKIFEPAAQPESAADFAKLNLMDIDGNTVKPALDRVTVIEYWTMDSHRDNMFWNRMREMEQKFAGNPDVQFLSINYDNVLNGKSQRKAVKEFLGNVTPPQNLLIDKDIGFRHFFFVPGPVAYVLIDHRKQYTHVGRGDAPETAEMFDTLIENAIKYMNFYKQQVTIQEN